MFWNKNNYFSNLLTVIRNSYHYSKCWQETFSLPQTIYRNSNICGFLSAMQSSSNIGDTFLLLFFGCNLYWIRFIESCVLVNCGGMFKKTHNLVSSIWPTLIYRKPYTALTLISIIFISLLPLSLVLSICGEVSKLCLNSQPLHLVCINLANHFLLCSMPRSLRVFVVEQFGHAIKKTSLTGWINL